VPTFGVTLVMGVLIGSDISVQLRRDFRLEGFESNVSSVGMCGHRESVLDGLLR
jgi:hypothetical protein